jgi:HrpA-like RNA helicase
MTSSQRDGIDFAWHATELPTDCYFRALTSIVGDPSLRGLPTQTLPIETSWKSIKAKIREHQVCAVCSPPGSGKTMGLPTMMGEVLNGDQWKGHGAILLVEPSTFGAEKVVSDLVDRFGWRSHEIHLRTGQHDTDMFQLGTTRLSVVTYGILWKWLTSHEPHEDNSADGSAWTANRLVDRYQGFILDEFAEVTRTQEEIATMLRKLLGQTHWADKRLVVTAASLREEEVRNLFGAAHEFLTLTARRFTMQRCIVAPRDSTSLLKVAAHLALASLQRAGAQRGNVIVFLPGISEILSVQKLLIEARADIQIPLLHSDCIGNDDEEQLARLDDGSGRPIVSLATTIAARTVTLENMKYAIIHPAVRVGAMHASGIWHLIEEPVGPELESNMAGRIARTSEGYVTYLYDVNDEKMALSHVHGLPRGAFYDIHSA